MGLKRWAKHLLFPNTFMTDMTKNMTDEGIVEGTKKSLKQEFCEDNPVTALIYKVGKSDGKVEGYAEASDVYEKKLFEQADLFLQEKKDFEKERGEYEALLDAYDKKINELQNNAEKTQTEKDLLQQLLLKERELKNMCES
jgi:hypothetical protein